MSVLKSLLNPSIYLNVTDSTDFFGRVLGKNRTGIRVLMTHGSFSRFPLSASDLGEITSGNAPSAGCSLPLGG